MFTSVLVYVYRRLWVRSRPRSGLNYCEIMLIIFLYAGDMAIIILSSDNVEDLQQSLNDLSEYCWMSIQKNQKSGRIRVNEIMEIIRNYIYLEIKTF